MLLMNPYYPNHCCYIIFFNICETPPHNFQNCSFSCDKEGQQVNMYFSYCAKGSNVSFKENNYGNPHYPLRTKGKYNLVYVKETKTKIKYYT